MNSKYEEIARKLEEHISVLADYDVIDCRVADTLTEYVWRIITEYDENQQTPRLHAVPVSKLGKTNNESK